MALSEEEARLLRRAVDPDPSHRPRFSDLATVFPVPKYPAARDTEFVTQWNANDRGTALLALGRHPEAIAEFAKALRPESPALMNIATSASQAGLVELANAAYTTLLNGNPHPQARANYAAHVLRYAVREKYEEGLQQCDKCLEVDPRNLTALSNKAALLNSLERYEEAFDAAEAVRSIDPKMPQAQFELAWAASKLNRYSKALSTAKDIVRNYPEFERAAELLRSLENQKKRK
ncbi:tetratricopeptide repeat protein [Cystobacter ferrugineus]|uniref:tetratricopeptide repeat protein n=1 Tax=Cystobacter ferrugineus TaxID=83449 RepID=UPI000A74B148|nr:tetratricopeptide repeat protein [Cystobacter ferrugineus]